MSWDSALGNQILLDDGYTEPTLWFFHFLFTFAAPAFCVCVFFIISSHRGINNFNTCAMWVFDSVWARCNMDSPRELLCPWWTEDRWGPSEAAWLSGGRRQTLSLCCLRYTHTRTQMNRMNKPAAVHMHTSCLPTTRSVTRPNHSQPSQ